MCGGVSGRIGRVDAPEGSCVTGLGGGGGRVVRCDIPFARRAETGAHILATFTDVETKNYLISYFVIISDLGSSNLGSLRRWERFFESHSFFEVGRRIGGVVSLFTYEMGNIYTYKY